MRYELFAVEVRARCNPEAWALAGRYNEDGPGSALTWTTREDAQAFIDATAGEGDPDPDMQVVPLTGETDSENEPDALGYAFFLGNRPLDEPMAPHALAELARTPDGADA
jgi:hypothetical protein